MGAHFVKEKAGYPSLWLKFVLVSSFSHHGSKHISKAREGTSTWVHGLRGQKSIMAGTVYAAGHSSLTPILCDTSSVFLAS